MKDIDDLKLTVGLIINNSNETNANKIEALEEIEELKKKVKDHEETLYGIREWQGDEIGCTVQIEPSLANGYEIMGRQLTEWVKKRLKVFEDDLIKMGDRIAEIRDSPRIIALEKKLDEHINVHRRHD